MNGDRGMPRWYFTKRELRQTPSVAKGMEVDIESEKRLEGSRFILDLGGVMNLGLSTTMATAITFFHRFYMFHSFQDFPHYPAACACLFLAGKVEETPKKCRDLIEAARRMMEEPKFTQCFGTDERNRVEEMMTLERILLQTIKFDLQIQHPYKYLLKYAVCIKGDKQRLEKMVQMAWNFVNDSLSTTLCLQWEPEIIAIALMHLASKLSKFEVVDWTGRKSEHLRWWDMFVDDMTIDVLEDICHQVLDFYAACQGPPEPHGLLPTGSTSSPQNHLAQLNPCLPSNASPVLVQSQVNPSGHTYSSQLIQQQMGTQLQSVPSGISGGYAMGGPPPYFTQPPPPSVNSPQQPPLPPGPLVSSSPRLPNNPPPPPPPSN